MNSIAARFWKEAKFFAVAFCIFLFLPVTIYSILPLELFTGPTDYDLLRRDMKVIGVAIRAYEATHDELPRAVRIDSQSNVSHSWRLFLLPYFPLESPKDTPPYPFHDDYDWSKPWNASENRSITQREMDCYRSPRHRKDQPRAASYLAVVEEGFVFDPMKAVTMEDITDGPSKTIMLVEVVDSDIEWAEPRDLKFAESIEYMNRQPEEFHGFLALMADGSVNYFKKSDFSEEQLHGLFTIHGGEKIDR